MPKRSTPLQAGHYYHIYNRGVNREAIFLRRDNWLFFLKRMRDLFNPELADIVAYCLMPNHYHLLVCLKSDEFGPKIMQPFGVSYTKAVNKQNDRVGPLFQGPFRAKLIHKDNHLLLLSRYIHLNPVRANYVERPQDWDFSSYQDYIGFRNGTIPKPGIIYKHFPTIESYREFVEGPDCDQDNTIRYLINFH
jgi:putative transposase